MGKAASKKTGAPGEGPPTSTRFDPGMREAIDRARRRIGLDRSNFIRMAVLERTKYEPDLPPPPPMGAEEPMEGYEVVVKLSASVGQVIEREARRRGIQPDEYVRMVALNAIGFTGQKL